MVSQLLDSARDYEAKEGKNIPVTKRPVYHLSPYVGWMNDPNGFSKYGGKYHLFYQYYPYGTYWGPMHWGHVVSEDLTHWDYLPAVLAPDQYYDIEGCWSGSAATLKDGRHLLLYTGRMVSGEEIHQVQCAAIGDGIEYHKVEENPIITGGDLPEGASIYDFRDPKIWWDDTADRYYAVIGSRAQDGHGQLLLYESENGLSWHYRKVLDASHGQIGSMWECPDFFELDGDAVLLISPQDMRQEGEFRSQHANVYIIGDYDRETFNFTRRHLHAIDYGYDFYAAQTMEGEDGRRIMIAWMQAWENARTLPYPYGWACMMTIPRELAIRDNRIYQNPVREIESRRGEKTTYKDVRVDKETELEGIRGRCLDMMVSVRPAEDSDYQVFEMRFARGEVCGRNMETLLRYDKREGKITFDRSLSGYPDDAMTVREISRDSRDGEISFRILLDRYSAEIFIDQGRYALTSVITTEEEADGIAFFADGDLVIDVEKYEIL